jgi:hypothetical protein
MLKVGIIKHAPPEAVKCCANTVLAKKAHKQEGMMQLMNSVYKMVSHQDSYYQNMRSQKN